MAKAKHTYAIRAAYLGVGYTRLIALRGTD